MELVGIKDDVENGGMILYSSEDINKIYIVKHQNKLARPRRNFDIREDCYKLKHM